MIREHSFRLVPGALQIHGGVGYTRDKSFESIYRHHRRHRLTEGSDEIPLLRIADSMFDFSTRS